MEAIYVGIDVSKEWLDVGVWPGVESWRVRNHANAVAELVERLRAASAVVIRFCFAAKGETNKSRPSRLGSRQSECRRIRFSERAAQITTG